MRVHKHTHSHIYKRNEKAFGSVMKAWDGIIHFNNEGWSYGFADGCDRLCDLIMSQSVSS